MSMIDVREAADRAGVTTQAVREAAARHGVLRIQQMVGRDCIHELDLRAWSRARGTGRTWSRETALAALDLLAVGSTARLDATGRYRARRALRNAADAAEIVHKLLGIAGSAHRYRGTSADGLDSVAHRSGDDDLARALGLGAAVDVLWRTPRELTERERIGAGLTEMVDGDLTALEGAHGDGDGRDVLDLFLYGGSREHAAAAGWFQQRAAGL